MKKIEKKSQSRLIFLFFHIGGKELGWWAWVKKLNIIYLGVGG